jgi:hypothetical protein
LRFGIYWLELSMKAGFPEHGKLTTLLKEADELTAIFTPIRKTSWKNKKLQQDSRKSGNLK